MKLIVLLAFLIGSQSFFAQKLIPFKSKGKWGYCDSSRKVVIKPNYFEASKFNSNGMAIVKNEKGLKGVINEDGKVIMGLKHKEIYFNPSFAYFGASGGKMEYFYDYEGQYDSDILKKIKEWVKLPESEKDGFFSNKIFVVKDGTVINWYNNKGKLIYESSKNDELISNYYSPGFTIKNYDKDSTPFVSHISDNGVVIFNKIEGDEVKALSVWTETAETKFYFMVNKEVGKEKKKLPEGIKRFASALYHENGSQVIGFNEGLSSVGDLYRDENNDIQSIVQKEINGAEDCAPEFYFGLFNITKGKFTYPLGYSTMSRVFVDRYSLFSGNNELFDKILLMVNSDTTFKSTREFKVAIKKYEREIRKETKEVSYLTMSKNKKHMVYGAKGEILKEVDLPKGITITSVVNKAMMDFDNFGRHGYNAFAKQEEEELVFKLFKMTDGYRSNGLYLTMDKEDKKIYRSHKNVNWKVLKWLDSLALKQEFKQEHFFLIDKDGKSISNQGYDDINIAYSEDNPLFLIQRGKKKGMIRPNGELIIDVKYDELIINEKDSLMPVFIGEIDGNYSLISNTGKVLIEPVKNELSFIIINGEYYIGETSEVFSRLTNEMERKIEGFYSLTGVKFEGQ